MSTLPSPMPSSNGVSAPHSRRLSFISARTSTSPAPKSRKSIFSAITSRSPQPNDTNETSARSVSPTGSTKSSTSLKFNTTPSPHRRASIRDTLKKIPSKIKLTGNAGATRPADTISAIPEVRQDTDPLEELQKKLRDASEILAFKSDEAAALAVQISEVQSSLDAALAQAEIKSATISDLEAAKNASTSEIERLKEEHVQLQADYQQKLVLLETVQKELEAAKTAALCQTEWVQTLQDRIAASEAEVSATKDNLQALRISHESDLSNAVAATQIERQALLKAQYDLAAISAKTEALETSHAAALEEITAQAEALENEIEELKAERGDNVNKLSELETEILELKKSREKVEHEHFITLSRLRKLEEDLTEAAAATQQALVNAQEREEAYARECAELRELHSQQLRIAKDDLAAVADSLETSQRQVAAVHVAHEQTKVDAETVAKEHARELEHAEQAQMNLQIELSEEIKRIATELESQEALHHAEVEAITAEHNILLQETIKRAKNDARSAHGRDLQALRAESQANIEQLRTAHQSSIETLKAEAAAATQQALENAQARERDHAREIGELRKHHDRQRQIAKDDLENMAASLQQQITAAHAAREQTKADAEVAVKEHARKLKQAEQAQLNQLIEHSEEIKKVTAELESREAQHHAKVEAIKVEHNTLLQESVKRAKNESQSAHGRDLQALRLESQTTIEQLRTAHHSSIESLKAEAAAAAQQASANAQTREAEHARKSEELRNLHNQQLHIAKDSLAKVTGTLEAFQRQMATARAGHEQTKADAEAAATKHLRDLEEAERAQTNQRNELSEAQATIEQLRSAHKSSIESLKAEHGEIVNDIEKRLTSQALELSTTTAVLAKAKAGRDTSRAGSDALKAQLKNAQTTLFFLVLFLGALFISLFLGPSSI